MTHPNDWSAFRHDEPPEWFTSKVANGGFFYVSVTGQHELDRIELSLIEYLTSLIGQPIHANENRFMRMSVPQVLEASERLHAQLARRMEKQNRRSAAEGNSNEKVVFEWPTGAFVIQFVSDAEPGELSLAVRQAMALETDRMGICVGSFNNKETCVGGMGEPYARGVERGTMQIYSIRDPNNAPHVTIEVNQGVVRQVKGKQNEPPIQTYVPYVKDFLNNLGLPADTTDIERIKLFHNEGRYGDVLDVGVVVRRSRAASAGSRPPETTTWSRTAASSRSWRTTAMATATRSGPRPRSQHRLGMSGRRSRSSWLTTN